jgi:hypothetical protein
MHKTRAFLFGCANGRAFMELVSLILAIAVIAPCSVNALPIQNPRNCHYYDVIDVIAEINWTDARATAEDMSFMGTPGHLVTIESVEENLFVTNTFGVDRIHYHWMGGIPEVGGRGTCGGMDLGDR